MSVIHRREISQVETLDDFDEVLLSCLEDLELDGRGFKAITVENTLRTALRIKPSTDSGRFNATVKDSVAAYAEQRILTSRQALDWLEARMVEGS